MAVQTPLVVEGGLSKRKSPNLCPRKMDLFAELMRVSRLFGLVGLIGWRLSLLDLPNDLIEFLEPGHFRNQFLGSEDGPSDGSTDQR